MTRSFEGGRYAVALEGGGESVRVRPGNLSPAVSRGGVAVSDEVVAAAGRGDEEAVLAWLNSGGRANATYEQGGVSGLTLLMLAAIQGHERVVDLLLQRGAEINQQNSRGGTALMGAARNGHERVVELLLQRGAEINMQDSDGVTALMSAAVKGHERVVELLLRPWSSCEVRRWAFRLPKLRGFSSRVRLVSAQKGQGSLVVEADLITSSGAPAASCHV